MKLSFETSMTIGKLILILVVFSIVAGINMYQKSEDAKCHKYGYLYKEGEFCVKNMEKQKLSYLIRNRR